MLSFDTRRANWLGFAAFLAFAAVPASVLGQEAPQDAEEPAPACTLTLEPAALSVGSAAQEVAATLSIEIDAEVDGIEVQEGSGLQAAIADPETFTLAIDASAAEAGEWKINATSAGVAVCTGTVKVNPAEAGGA